MAEQPAKKRVKIADDASDDSSQLYMPGFGNHFSTEAAGYEGKVLPVGQNNPQKVALGLYAEQLNGTAFTAPRNRNKRSWYYRMRPSVCHEPFQKASFNPFENDFGSNKFALDPSQLRWGAHPLPSAGESKTFLQGITTTAGNGDASLKEGLAIYWYSCNADMTNSSFYNSDGEFLIVPQVATLRVTTENGRMSVPPGHICVIPRGIKFSVSLGGAPAARGYILEVFSGSFILPDLGPIGSNGLANPRDFEAPVAAFEEKDGVTHTIFNKFGGELFQCTCAHSPFDVVAWHGNLTPYRYDLSKFVCINSVTVDHPDPSIYTVLTCQSLDPGVAVADFVIFPPRWMVMERTFRPPWYHRNTMTEFMGMIWGKYDAKVGFCPGGSSLHSCMSAHGPDAPTFEGASKADLKPDFFGAGLAFMFETKYILKVAAGALKATNLDRDYHKCWRGLKRHFPATSAAAASAAAAASGDGASAASKST